MFMFDKIFTFSLLWGGAGAFAGLMLVHVLVWRLLKVRKQILWLFLIFLGLPTLAFLASLARWVAPVEWALWYLLVFTLSSCYILFFPAVQAESPTLTMVRHLDRNKGKGGLTRDEIMAEMEFGSAAPGPAQGPSEQRDDPGLRRRTAAQRRRAIDRFGLLPLQACAGAPLRGGIEMIVLSLAISAPLIMMILHVALRAYRLRRRRAAGAAQAGHPERDRRDGDLGRPGRRGPLAAAAAPTPAERGLRDGRELRAGYVLFQCLRGPSETALRIRFLLESYLAEKRDQAGPAPGFEKEYDPATMIGVRIDRLLAMGAARGQDGKILMVNVPLILTAKLFHFARSVWRGVLFGSADDDRSWG